MLNIRSITFFVFSVGISSQMHAMQPITGNKIHEESLVLACQYQRGPLIDEIIRVGNVTGNFQDIDGKTGLHYACHSGREDIVAKIIGLKDLDPNIKDAQGRSALYHAVSSYGDRTKAKNIVIMLMKLKNIDPNTQENEGYTPLHLACMVENVELVEILMSSNDTDPSIRIKGGPSSLDIAMCGMKNDDYNVYQIARYTKIFKLLNRDSGSKL